MWSRMLRSEINIQSSNEYEHSSIAAQQAFTWLYNILIDSDYHTKQR